MDIFVGFLGGLGLMLTGLSMLSVSTRQASGPWLRAWVARRTRTPGAAALTGFLAGAATQSSNAVTIVGAGLVQSGLLGIQRALPLISWANVGTCGLVLAASLDSRALALLLVGVAGVMAFFRIDLRGRIGPLLGALVGLGLTLLGLAVLKAGIAPLQDIPAVRSLLGGQGAAVTFVAAVAIATLAQTSAPATLIALALATTGAIRFEEAVIAIYGGNIGSGLGMLLAARGLTGTARRLAQYQVVWRIFGSTLFLGLLAAEVAGVPNLLTLTAWLAGEDMSLRVGLLVVFYQAATAALMWPLDRPAARLLATWAPETPAEALSRPRYLYPAAAEDTATALDLAARETGRLAERLPMLLDEVREGGLTAGHPGRAALEAGSTALEGALDDFLADALSQAGTGTDRALLDGLVGARARSADLAALREAVGGLAAIAEAADPDQPAGELLGRMAEALHLLLSEYAEAVTVADAEAAATLRELTADRSEMLEALRRRIARSDAALPPASHEALLRAMALFERAVWLLRRQAVVLREG